MYYDLISMQLLSNDMGTYDENDLILSFSYENF